MTPLPADGSYQLHLDGLAPWPEPDPVVVRLEKRFDRIRKKLVAEHQGCYALLLCRGTKLVPELKIFERRRDAIDAGFLDPEHRRFCVKEITEFDVPIDLGPRYFLGFRSD